MSLNFTKSLILRLLNGDEEAFRLIYEQYWSRLYALCYYYTRSREDTEDILMDIFTSLWNNHDQIHIESLDSYLVKAAKNQSLKYIQKRQRKRKQVPLFEEQIESSIPEYDHPDKLLEMKEFSLQLESQIQSLPEKTKRIFLLNRDNGLTYRQIASSLNISEKTVEYHVSKALRILTSHAFILMSFILLK